MEHEILSVQVGERGLAVGDGHWQGAELVGDNSRGRLRLANHGRADQQNRAARAEMSANGIFFIPVMYGTGSTV